MLLRPFFALGRTDGHQSALQYLSGLVERRRDQPGDTYSLEFLSLMLADKQRAVIALGIGGATASEIADYGAGHEAGFTETVAAGAAGLNLAADIIDADTARQTGALQ